MIEDLKTHDIFVYTALVQVKEDLLWQRILKRLEVEPQRKKFNEDDKEWMQRAVAFYNSKKWDFRIVNDTKDVHDAFKILQKQLKKKNLLN